LATSDGKTELCTRHLLVANSSTDRKGQPQIAIERIVVFRTSLVSSYWTLLLYFVRGDLLHFLAQLSVYPSEESPPAHRRRFGLDPIFTKSFGVRKSVPAHKSGPPRWHCICCATLKNPVIPTATAKPVLTRQVFYLPWKLNPSPQLLLPVQWLSATRLWSAGIGSRPRQMLTANPPIFLRLSS
jgi:hypothetical protein